MIGPKIIGEAKEMIGRLLDDNLDLIDQAYVASEGGLTISLSVKVEPSKKANFKVVECGINFVVHRAKNQLSREVSEIQESLFAIPSLVDGLHVTFTAGPENQEIKG